MAKGKILVVEDDNIIAMEIKDRVENLGYTVPAIVTFGEQALKQAEKISPDLILMDIRLKGKVDGIAAAEQIRKHYDIPVIYLTAYADDDTLQRAKITEPFGYVIKPFEERDLASTIQMALYKHKMEKKLKDSERWLATTLTSIGEGVIATDTKGRIKFMNPLAEQLTGWTQKKAMGKELSKVFNIIDEDTRKKAENPVTKVIRDGCVKEVLDHSILISKSGQEIPILESASPIKNDKGEITGVVVVFQDNTERKKAQQDLATQNKYNQLRASLWKLAAFKSLTEDEMIEKMLESIGSVIGVSRVSYNKLYGNYLQEGEFKCILEWSDTGVKPTLGATVPASLVNHFLKDDIIVLTSKTALKRIPRALHPVLKSIMKIFESVYNLEAIWVVPYYLNKQLEGVLSFDICKDLKCKPVLTDEVKNIIFEAIGIVSNYINKNRAEQALRESEERFRTIFETTPDSIFIKDRFLQYTHVNPAMEKLFGMSASELIGLTDEKLFGTEIGRQSREVDSRVLEGEIVQEEQTKPVNGVNTTFDVVKVPMRNHLGEIIGLCGIARDITDRKRVAEVQQVLYEISNAVNVTKDLRELFKSIRDHLGRVVDTSNFFIALYNKEDDTLSLPFFVDEKDKFSRFPARKTLTSYVIRKKAPLLIKEEGMKKLVEEGEIEIVGTISKVWLGVPLKIGDNVIGVVVVQSYEDETLYTKQHLEMLEFVSGQIALAIERKRAEEERVRLVTAVEQAAEGILITDENAVIQYVNPAFEKITGFTSEEAIGKTPRILKSGKQNERFYKELWDTILEGKAWRGHFTNRRKDGTLYEEEVAISPIRDESGKILNYVAVTRDVTEQYRLENQLRQAQKMEAIGTLAGGIAHDFNNIIGAIIGYTELSLDDVDDERTIRNLEQIIKASHRAKDLVQQILAFSRYNEQEHKPLQVSLIINEALKLLRASLPSTIEIRKDIQAKRSLIMADPTQIHQVLMNLCTNAAHAMHNQNGVLEVSLKNIEIDVDSAARYQELKPGHYVKLSVSDTGCGINPKIVDRIFDPYFTTKKVGEGSGMGLALVHGIIKNHKGEITVYSEPGVGTTFNLFFPRIFSEIKTESIRNNKSIPKGHEKILFVDDERNLVQVGKQMLERLGYDVVSTLSSTEALKIFRGQPENFDLVITDQTMPEMTGAELAQKVLEIRSDIPVILCTGYSEAVSRQKAREMGIKEFIMKPLFTVDIANIIRQVLDGGNDKES